MKKNSMVKLVVVDYVGGVEIESIVIKLVDVGFEIMIILNLIVD